MEHHKSIFNKLTKKQLVHLIEGDDGKAVMDVFRANRKIQKEHDAKPGAMISCLECRMIARKLGIE
jgi:hypothetical protein